MVKPPRHTRAGDVAASNKVGTFLIPSLSNSIPFEMRSQLCLKFLGIWQRNGLFLCIASSRLNFHDTFLKWKSPPLYSCHCWMAQLPFKHTTAAKSFYNTALKGLGRNKKDVQYMWSSLFYYRNVGQPPHTFYVYILLAVIPLQFTLVLLFFPSFWNTECFPLSCTVREPYLEK